ncbi:MAG: hypothetical protein ACI9FG_001642 [Crocinitomicaceae bacterium]|jgi:hypothetical protein
MHDSSDLSCNPKSTFGILSVACPVIGGIGFFSILFSYPADPAGFGGAFIAIYFFFALPFLGLLSSLVGMFRKERLKGWFISGLIVNLPLVLITLSFILK